METESRSGFRGAGFRVRRGPLPAGLPGPRASRGPALPRATGRCLSPGSGARGELTKWRPREAGAARGQCTPRRPLSPPHFARSSPLKHLVAARGGREPERLPSRTAGAGAGAGHDKPSWPPNQPALLSGALNGLMSKAGGGAGGGGEVLHQVTSERPSVSAGPGPWEVMSHVSTHLPRKR